MSRIVNGGKSDRHIVKPYQFKTLDNTESSEEFKKEEIKEVSSTQPVVNEEENAQTQEANPEVVERLLEKIEELSNNIVKTQIEHEKELKECFKKCEEEKQTEIKKAIEEAKSEAKKECESLLDETKKLYEDSIKKLEEINKTFEEKLNSLEKELSAVALDMAREIIQKEISKDSSEVAYSLAKALLEELKDASRVTIKVNPKNAEFLKGKFDNIVIIPDEAVKEGGVVIQSDIGNIDASIEERFKALKEAVEGK